MIVRWLGACLVAVALAACGGKGTDPAKDVPADLPDVADVPIVTPDYGTDKGPTDPGERDEGTVDDGVAADEGVLIDVPPDPAGETGTDVKADGPCVPDCEGRVCGSDGCGDVCGYCQQGYLCTVDGTCEIFCRTECTDKVCGADGCGGVCPPGCADNEECSPSFTCVLKSCEPKCAGKVCGPDGCGGTCGAGCEAGFLCTPQGQCTQDTNCYDVTATGRCIGNERQWCENAVLLKETCDTAGGFVCGYDNLAKKFMCRKPEVCVPQCTGKTCGPDGCSGTCGTCTGDQVCSTGGKCGAPCNGVTDVGICVDEYTLAFCHQGILLQYDCFAANPPVQCRLNPETGKYDCF